MQVFTRINAVNEDLINQSSIYLGGPIKTLHVP